MSYRVRTIYTSNKAPVRLCQCGHEVWLHKGYTDKCVERLCGCEKMRLMSKEAYFKTRPEMGGTAYDSGFERDMAVTLEERQANGCLKEVRPHVPFELRINGEKVDTYIADFVVTHNDGSVEVIETKGFFKPYERLKWRVFSALYGKDPKMTIRLIKDGRRMPKRV